MNFLANKGTFSIEDWSLLGCDAVCVVTIIS
jgi:hypothetical protein